MTGFTNIITNVGNHKTVNLLKTGLNICGPCIYGLNALNKCDLDSPRCW